MPAPTYKYCLVWVVGFTVLGGALLTGMFAFNGGWGRDPVGPWFQVLPLGGLLALVITALAAGLSRRPPTFKDALRVSCWTLFGLGLGWPCCGGGYYYHFWPQYAFAARAFSTVSVFGSLAAVALISLLVPNPPKPDPNACKQCGYLLTGLPEPRCPECGTTFQNEPEKPRD